LEDVSVAIMNYGNTQLSNFNINWTINGVPQPVFNYTGTLDTIGGAGEFMDTVLLGVGNFPIGMHNLSTWVVVANDVDNNNDTITTTINAIQYAAVLENDTICKGKDAKVTIDPNAGFVNGNVQWYMSIDGINFTAIANA